jgi:uncharacterized PurR-regulated membrane protein YhhQ (DUF165 family)
MDKHMTRKMETTNMKTIFAIAAYAATIPLANWMIGNVGTCIPDGPCLIPVGFGLMAPSGVLVVGLSLVLRDLVQETSGVRGSLIAITIGAALSWLFASPFLVVASVAAFMLSELVDLAVYTPLRKERLYLAVLLSGLVGAVVDSAVFLIIAFGSLDFIAGQVVGKLWMSLSALIVLWFIRNRCKIFGHKWRFCRDYGYGFTEKCANCGDLIDRGTGDE